MIQDDVRECLSCLNPLCEKGCPVGNQIRDFIKAVKINDMALAQRLLYAENPFPAITCRICAFEKQCEGHCVKHFKGEPVKVHKIEQHISDYDEYESIKACDNGRSIALIGGGIANLALAKMFLLEGYSVDVYEKNNFLGGAIMTGIPNFRLDKKYFYDISRELIQLGLKTHYGYTVDANKLLKLQTKFDRVVIGTGAQVERKMGIPGEENAATALKVLYDFNVSEEIEKYENLNRVLVVGGGNVAMDVARSLKHVVDDVTVVYRRDFEQMPANVVEIDEAKAENVNFLTLTNLLAIEKTDDKYLTTLVKMELGEKGADGRASFKEVLNSEYQEEFDLVVLAIGQKFKPLVEDMVVDKHETNYPNIYVVGDAYLGPSSVAHCIGDAKEVKKIIDLSYLKE